MASAAHLAALALVCVQAVWHLAAARRALPGITPEAITARNSAATARATSTASALKGPRHAAQIEQVAFVIPRVASRLPWRADCLVQALAAQDWLAARGVPAQITIGAARAPDGGVIMHAWLSRGGKVIVGGDIAHYAPLLTPDEAL
jgi:hypothetical protein